MRFPSKEIVEMVRKQYPIGTRVELTKMDDIQAPPIGTKGLTNMFDIYMVQRLAYENDFYELVNFIEENKEEYVHFILYGDD